MDTDSIAGWLKTNALISRFCAQNGWIDNDTLRYEVRSNTDQGLRINVYFTEILMEGSGCVADRIERFGQVDLRLDAGGRVVDARIV